jgi:hypothetical protein
MKRAFTLVIVATAVVVLAACNVTVTPPGPPANTIDVTATLNPGAPLGTINALGPAQSQVFRVAVPVNVANADLIYIELDKDIELEVLPAAYTSVIYSSNSAAMFSSGRAGILSVGGAGVEAEAVVDGQTVTTPVTCRGSCVLVAGNTVSDPFYVRVRNDGGSAVNVALYVYGDDYGDDNEPFNGNINTAPVLTAFDAGAIETAGDFDLWEMGFTGTVAFDTVVNGIVLEARVLNSSGVEVPTTSGGGPYFDGQEFSVLAGEFVRVRAVTGGQAAASARSTFYLENVSPLVR